MKKVLTIAGSDCSGGAGIQADLKTMVSNKVYGMSIITALTAQNTVGVSAIENVSTEFIEQQFDSIFTDIVPNAVKIGMVSNSEIVDVIVEKLKLYDAKNIVLDPVMVSTSGSKLMRDEAIEAIKTGLMPLATIITPNLKEAEVLSGITINTKEDMEKSARLISEFFGGAILVKGGHLLESADDLLYIDGESIWIEGKRIENNNTHGTGCTLSSAIACNLAKGRNILDSVKLSKNYINMVLEMNLNLGNGSGPLDHTFTVDESILNNW